MSFVEDMFKGGNIVTGLAIAAGAAIVVPVVAPLLRPLVKSVIKVGLVAYDQGRVALNELNERTGDIVGEARSEMARPGDESGSDEPAVGQRTRRGKAESPAPA
jgi:Protein of unknown function (DUF5132)